MAINLHCRSCKTDNTLTAKKCSKCGKALSEKNKTYRVIVRDRGKRVTRLVPNLTLAKEIESTLKVEIARGEYDLSKKKAAPVLDAVWSKYLLWAKENKKEASWQTDLYYYNTHIKPLFGNISLERISPFDIEKMIIAMKKAKSKRGKPYSDATIKHQIVLLSHLYTCAERWGMYQGANPCKKVKKTKLNNETTRFLNQDEIARLNEVLADWPNRITAGIIIFAMYTGLRRGEIFKLEWRDIDFDRQALLIRDPKGKKDNVVPLSDAAINILNDLPRRDNCSLVFPNPKGNRFGEIRGTWASVRKAAQLPDDFRFHDLRHNYASHLVSSGVPLYTVSQLLSHKDAKTTQRYAHLADESLKAAANLSGEIFANAQTRERDKSAHL